MTHRIALCLTALALLMSACGNETDSVGDKNVGTPDSTYLAEIEIWHAERIAALRDDTGWLTLVGLHPLRPGPQTVGFGDGVDIDLATVAPPMVGVIDVQDEKIWIQIEPGVTVTHFFDPEQMPLEGTVMNTDQSRRMTVLAVDAILFYVIDRDGDLYLRVKDREAEVLRNFTGIERFPVEGRWRVRAQLEGEPGTIVIPDVLGHQNESPSPGVLVFTIDGVTHRLTPQSEPSGRLFLIFADATNGVSTYGAGRFLGTEAPDSLGAVIIDFNKAFNPPCVFTEYATCPLPPPQNVLKIPVTAGEKMWDGRH